MGIPLLAGRDAAPSDTRETPSVAVVSESFAGRHWPGEDALGRRFEFGFAERTVVGVVGDVRMRGLERTAEPQVYLASSQMQDAMLAYYYAPKDLVIRAEQDPLALLPAVREIVRAADPEQPISDVRLLADVLGENTAPRRVQVRVLAAFAGIALLLAALGLHGLLSFAVSQRKQEIGVRVALGARRSSVVAMVVRQSTKLAGAGVVLGVGAGIAAGRSMRALLAGVAPVDTVAIALSVGLAVSISLVGSLLPALRAARVDPTTAIREG
jgi:ABC-type antimicrobial peptide transport system permease subunit